VRGGGVGRVPNERNAHRVQARRVGTRETDGSDGEEAPRSAGVRNPQHAVEPGVQRSNDPTSPASLLSPLALLLLLLLRRTTRPLADELSQKLR